MTVSLSDARMHDRISMSPAVTFEFHAWDSESMNAAVLLRLRWVLQHHTCALNSGWLHRCSMARGCAGARLLPMSWSDGSGMSVMFCDTQDKTLVLERKTYEIIMAPRMPPK